MVGFVIFYFLIILVLFFDRKYIPLLYSTIWFLFVGFRDEIGTDYNPIILSFERGYIDFTNISASFKGYMLVDLELLFKFFSTLIYYLNLDFSSIHIIVSGIEAFLIYKLIKHARNQTKLLVIVLTLTFLLNYPMNITRNGLAFIFVVYAQNIHGNGQKNIFYRVLAMISHYSSIPIIVLTWIKIKKIANIVIGTIFLALLIILFKDLIAIRYPIDDISGFKFKGLGIKLFLGTLILLITNTVVVRRSILCQENLIIIGLMIVTYLFNPFARYNMFYSFFVMYSNLFLLRDRKITPLGITIFLLYPILVAFGEWLEIYRYQGCEGCGNWIPYKNKIIGI